MYIKDILIPSLRQMREQYSYFGKAVLIMDNYQPHINALQQIDFNTENIVIHFLPAHSSDQMQPLDTEIFTKGT